MSPQPSQGDINGQKRSQGQAESEEHRAIETPFHLLSEVSLKKWRHAGDRSSTGRIVDQLDVSFARTVSKGHQLMAGTTGVASHQRSSAIEAGLPGQRPVIQRASSHVITGEWILDARESQSGCHGFHPDDGEVVDGAPDERCNVLRPESRS